MSSSVQNPLDHPEVRMARARGYVAAFVIASTLIVIAFLYATHNALPTTERDTVLAVIAIVAMAIQSFFLFHLDFSQTQRWHTTAFVLTIPLFALLVGLTMWMFHALALRTMIPGSP